MVRADNRAGRSAIRAMARLVETIESATDMDRLVSFSVGVIRGGLFVKFAEERLLRNLISPRYRVITMASDFASQSMNMTEKVSSLWNTKLGSNFAATAERLRALIARERGLAARERTRALVTIAADVIARYRREKDRRALLDYSTLVGEHGRLAHGAVSRSLLEHDDSAPFGLRLDPRRATVGRGIARVHD